jgi:RNA 3'-terminal phosphate cyclase (ATP)
MGQGQVIEIDGSQGEAGGQILRTSLALSALTGKALQIKNIRASRPKPGLRPQHLASVRTIAEICNAELKGASPDSKELSFSPKEISSTNLNVSIGTAGSISLLLQQAMPAALLKEIKLHVSGGTNVPFSPPFEFLQHALLPALRKMGARFEAKLSRRGYFPRGNGLASFSSKPAKLPLKPVSLTNFGKPEFIKLFSHCASLPRKVAENQASSARHALKQLNLEFEETIECRENASTIGSGITLLAFTSTGAVLSGSALGKKGLPAEQVGREAAEKLLKQLAPKKACDSHLADQLIQFMALAKGKSEIQATSLTRHCQTNIAVTEKFLPVKFEVQGSLGKPASISVEGASFKLK